MNKFNKKNRSFQKERRDKKSIARKQKGRPQLQQVVQVVSGKQQRKLDNKWKRAQKEALDSGLVTMQDIEMLVADNDKEGSRPSVPNASGSGKGRVKVVRKLKVHLKQRKVRVRVRGSVKSSAREQGAEGGSKGEMMME